MRSRALVDLQRERDSRAAGDRRQYQHLAAVEHFWFRRVLAGQVAPRLYRSADGRNEAFDGAVADPAVVAEAWDT
jgi:hypothetical protein